MHARILILPLLVIAAGCATLSEEECLQSDWRAIGYEDGAQGYPAERIGEHREACAKHGVTPDLEAYRAGREEGLQAFCRPEGGFRAGAEGRTYEGVCPPELEVAFMPAYEQGRELNRLERRVERVEGDIDGKRRELRSIQRRLYDIDARMRDDDTSRTQYQQLAAEAKDLARRQGQIEADIIHLQNTWESYQADLEDYRRTITYPY